MQPLAAPAAGGGGGAAWWLLVSAYRGVDWVEAGLEPVTILTGRNDAGKSSLLEALILAASAAAGMRDWLGRDTLRMIVDGKLMGRPRRLIRGGGEARAELRLGGLRVGLRIRPAGEEGLRSLLCMAARSLAPGGGAHRRAVTAFALALAEAGESLPGSWDTAARLVGLVAAELGRMGRCPARAEAAEPPLRPAAEQAAEALAGLVEGVAGESVSVEAVVGGEAYRLLYTPSRRVVAEEARRRQRGLSEALTAVLEVLLGARGGGRVGHAAGRLAARLAELLGGALGGRVAGQPRGGGGALVFPLLHRVLGPRGERGLVSAVTEAVRGLQGMGLLGGYNAVLEEAGIGIRDPLIRGDEAYFYSERSGGAVPASLLGDGTLYMALLLAGLTLLRSAGPQRPVVVAVEEPETGLHPGYMEALARLTAEAVEAAGGHGVVAFTTHSLELIRLVTRHAEEEGAEVLLMHSGTLYSVFRGSELREAAELEADLRGL